MILIKEASQLEVKVPTRIYYYISALLSNFINKRVAILANIKYLVVKSCWARNLALTELRSHDNYGIYSKLPEPLKGSGLRKALHFILPCGFTLIIKRTKDQLVIKGLKKYDS